jgi:hypothetical protein
MDIYSKRRNGCLTIIIVLLILVFYFIYREQKKEFLTAYNRCIIKNESIDRFLEKFRNNIFLTDKLLENLYFQVAVLNLSNTDINYVNFRTLYPNSLLLNKLERIYEEQCKYLIRSGIPERGGDFFLQEVKIVKKDTMWGAFYDFWYSEINCDRSKKDFITIVDEKQNLLDISDIRNGYWVRLNSKLTKENQYFKNKIIPNNWTIINYIKPKLIVIKNANRPKGYSEPEYYYNQDFINIRNCDINNKLLPLEYKVVDYDEFNKNAWGILTYQFNVSEEETKWMYRNHIQHYSITNIKFKNVDNLNTTWDYISNSYRTVAPNNNSQSANDYIETGELKKLPKFMILFGNN